MKYHVISLGQRDFCTNDPMRAIRAWYLLEPKNRTCVAICSHTWADAKALLAFASEHMDAVRALHCASHCTYKESYILDGVKEAVNRDGSGFYENRSEEYVIDQIWPFCFG